MTVRPASALLFDLDGTLVDSAPDLHAVANSLRADRGLSAMPYEMFRPSVSRGGRAMLASAFPDLAETDRDDLIETFLQRYHDEICVHSKLFDGMADVLDHVEGAGIPWGIVTNKPGWLSSRLLAAMELDTRCAVVIAGDTLAVRKPDPEPVRAACRALSADVSGAVFVGDDRRDVEAGRAAGCRTVVAGWGYVPGPEDTLGWGADIRLDAPITLLDLAWLQPG